MAEKKRGRPPLNTPANKLKAEKKSIAKQEDMYCTHCGKFKKEDEFYKSFSCSNKHFGRMTVCINCIVKMYDDLFLENDSQRMSIFVLCSELNLPYIDNVCQASIDGKAHTIRGYITKLNSLPQYKGMTFKDGESLVSKIDQTRETNKDLVEMKTFDKEEGIIRWGNTWNEYELSKLESFYHAMMAKNRIETPQDEDYLKKLAMLSLKIDEAIISGESTKAKSMGDLYSKYMQDAKFRAQDMTDADKQGGIRTFSQIYAEVERDDFIPPWEKFANMFGVKQDLVDKTIMHYMNFIMRFNKAERLAEPPNDTPTVDNEPLVGEDNG